MSDQKDIPRQSKILHLDNISVPCVPFLWYREEEFVCPFEKIMTVPVTNEQKLSWNIVCDQTECDLIVQSHIFPQANIYICLHSLMYSAMHTHSENLTLSATYHENKAFHVKILPLLGNHIHELHGGVKLGQYVHGQVHIHDLAFSPAGCLHFKICQPFPPQVFVCHVLNDDIGINKLTIHVLVDDECNVNDINSLCDKLLI